MIQDVLIRRPKKHEAEMAIKDLEARGFKKVSDLTEFTKEGKLFKREYQYNRRVFVENTHSSVWICKMRRETE